MISRMVGLNLAHHARETITDAVSMVQPEAAWRTACSTALGVAPPSDRTLYSPTVMLSPARAIVLTVLAGLWTATQSPPPGQMPLVIRNVGIVSMITPEISVGAVLVRDGLIAYVGSTAGLPDAAGARTIDGTGKFVVPGLIDMHTHVSKTRGSSLGLLVANGVTTVRDLGGDLEELLRWRREILSGNRVGPRLLIAGPYLESGKNAARQHGTPVQEMVEPAERTRIGVGTPADADRVIADIAARGVDHVKIRTVENRETYLAIGDAARRHGLALAGHFQPFSFDDVIDSGQRSIEHAFYPSLQERSPSERRAFLRRLAQNGVAIVPTLVVLERLGRPEDAELKSAVDAADRDRLLSAFLRADWREQLAEQGPERRRLYADLQANAKSDLAEARAAGVRLLAGTDIGVLNVFPGGALHEELALLVRDVGMTPYEALQAATLHAAEFIGLAREVGSIAAGKQADMVLLDANPLENIANISRIDGVILRGRHFDRSGIARILTDVSGSPDVALNDWPRKSR
jgi:imidazolonepropionase-like amidohydrolase